MQNTLKEALRAQATFNFVGDQSNDKKVALLPGIYSAMKFVQDGTSKVAVMSFSDPTDLNNAGYACDQVADDYNSADSGQYVQVTGVGRVKFRDFLNAVQRVGLRVSQIIIQNKVSSQAIFDQQIEIAKTVLGAKGGMDFITLQQYVNVNAYDRSKITIDLSDETLDLTPEVFMAINVPAGASFSIQFVFDSMAAL
ncbi:MAG: hypothetical protein K6A94_12070 [Bacteroidales bacterium]|nr:hypothetical protein [Bacteroidales bacterium]